MRAELPHLRNPSCRVKPSPAISPNSTKKPCDPRPLRGHILQEWQRSAEIENNCESGPDGIPHEGDSPEDTGLRTKLRGAGKTARSLVCVCKTIRRDPRVDRANLQRAVWQLVRTVRGYRFRDTRRCPLRDKLAEATQPTTCRDPCPCPQDLAASTQSGREFDYKLQCVWKHGNAITAIPRLSSLSRKRRNTP